MSKAAVLMMVALSGELSAQSAQAWRDSTYRLTQQARSVRDSIKDADAGVKDIARRSGLVISASEKPASIAQDVLAGFDSLRQHWFGTALPDPNGFSIVIRGGEGWSFGDRVGTPQSLTISGLPDTGSAPRALQMIPGERLADADKAIRILLFEYGGLMMRTAPEWLQRWLPSGLLLHLTDESRKEQAMYALVTGDGKAQRDCVHGDAGACAYAMGLRPSTDHDPGGQYYPLAQADLVLTALELGGAGAWERLGGAGTIEASLARASGMPADSLLMRWRDGLLALRPDRGPLDASTAAVLLGWSALVLAAGLAIARWV